MLLDEYLFRMKIKQTEFAKKLEVSRVHLGEILRGRRRPSISLAKRIEETTNGKVSKEELLFPEEYSRA
jgi:transcriptional regulator with XRE-family HTH domain